MPFDSSNEELNKLNNICTIDIESAKKIDEELFKTFDVLQLIEIAGLSVAEAINDYIEKEHLQKYIKEHPILIICGSGNNGCDSLVCARYLLQFGYKDIHIFIPKLKKNSLHEKLLKQVKYHNNNDNISIVNIENISDLSKYHCIIDGIFGFGFDSFGLISNIRAPYNQIISWLIKHKTINQEKVYYISIDIPSANVIPTDVLISLTIPKENALKYCNSLNKKVTHYLAGRFLNDQLKKQFKLINNFPIYPNEKLYIKLN